jgi:hypothetical protein
MSRKFFVALHCAQDDKVFLHKWDAPDRGLVEPPNQMQRGDRPVKNDDETRTIQCIN